MVPAFPEQIKKFLLGIYKIKLPVVSGEKTIKAFLNAGFVKVRQRGSHVRLEKIEGSDIIKLTVPLHNPMKKGIHFKKHGILTGFTGY